jgi:ATP-binding cassette, subfamily B, heavy metal transporter
MGGLTATKNAATKAATIAACVTNLPASPPLPMKPLLRNTSVQTGKPWRVLPYLWMYKWRVGFALTLMIGAKMANVSVPLLLKRLIDSLTLAPGSVLSMLVVPLGLLVAYGLLRLSTTLFTEARELVFAKATEGATRHITLQVFEHLHRLSLRFHLARQTGGMTRDIERVCAACSRSFLTRFTASSPPS